MPALFFVPYFGSNHLGACAAIGVAAAVMGLWEKYRSDFGCCHVLFVLARFAAMLAIGAIGGVGVLVLFILRRADLVSSAGTLASLGLAASFALGAGKAAKMVRREPPQPEPEWLRARVDLASGYFVPLAQGQGEQVLPWWQGLVLAFGLNFHLLWQSFGFEEYSFVVVLVPAVLAIVGRAMFPIGREIAYTWHIRQLERARGRGFEPVDIEHVRALRRTFWFAKWLCRPEDLVAPPVPPPRLLSRKKRRRLSAAEASIER